MTIVIAPTAFKGTLGPGQAARAIARGIGRRHPHLAFELAPISDGGDGFLECLENPLRARRSAVVVRGPVHAPVAASYGVAADGRGIVEAARAVGMALLGPGQLDPLAASSGGLGELLAEVRQGGARGIAVGIGGSAGTDGGTGMARALGYRFLDARGKELPEGGGSLARLARIDASGFDASWLMVRIDVACDVDNPLLGPGGTAAVYAPQKGASPAEVERLAEGMEVLAAAILRDLGLDVGATPHGGAAGGLGAGLLAFLGAHLAPGAELVIEAVGLRTLLGGATGMVTGEGRLDGQSVHGKAPVTAGRCARGAGVRSVALVGSTGPGWEVAMGDAFDEVRVIAPGEGPPPDTAEAERRLVAAAALLDF